MLDQRKMKAYISFNRRNRRTWQGFKFDKEKGCLTCPSKAMCIKPKERRARVFVKAGYIFTGPQNRYRSRALKLRKMIERKFGEAKKWHGMRRARYRAIWKVAIQVLMTFLVMNAKRIARLLKERPVEKAFQPALVIRAG